MLRTLRTTAALGLLVGVLAAPAAQAALIEVDLLAGGDGLITRDTATGLDWLDLTPTNGISINAALALSVVADHGFQVATIAQVGVLFANAGIASSAANAADFVPAQTLMGLVGCTRNCSGSYFPESKGHAIWTGTTIRNALIALNTNSSLGSANTAGNFPADPYNTAESSASASAGTWLVRASPVPEPTSALLIASGLMLAGAASRRR